MKEQTQQPGVRKWAGDDMIALQAEPLSAIQGFFKEYGNCIIQGCATIPAAGGKFNIAPGLLGLSGMDADRGATFKVVPFSGVENVTLPLYFTLTHSVVDRVYGDGKVKPIAYDYRAAVSAVKPVAGVEFLELTTTGGRRFVDAVKITEKLDKVGNGKDVTVTFAQAATRENIASGEKLTTILGKIIRWLADLKALAFKDKVSKTDMDAALQGELDGKLNLSGGTMTAPLYVNYPASDIKARFAKTASNDAAVIGINNANDLALCFLKISPTDVNYYNGASEYKMWHSGNFNPATKEPVFTKNTAFNKNFGTAAGTVCQGNDARLSDSRPANGGNADTVGGKRASDFATVNVNGNQNLNNLNGFGMLSNPSDNLATSENNYPIKQAGMLIFGNAVGGSANQLYGTYYGNRWFARGGGSAPGQKTAWKEFAMLDPEGNLSIDTTTASYIALKRNNESVAYMGLGSPTKKDILLLLYKSGNFIRIGEDGKNYSNTKEIATVDQIPTNFSQIEDAVQKFVAVGTILRKTIVTAIKIGNGYVSRVALGLTNPLSRFSPAILSVGANDLGTEWVDYTFGIDGRISSPSGTFALTSEIKALSGGATPTAGQYVSGITVNDHEITVTKAALPITDRGSVNNRDWNTILEPGSYNTSPQHWGTNNPAGVYQYGLLTVECSGNSIVQTYYESLHTNVCYRVKSTGLYFSAWTQIAKKENIPTTTAGLTDTADKRFMSDAQETKLDGSLEVAFAGIVGKNGEILKQKGRDFFVTNNTYGLFTIRHYENDAFLIVQVMSEGGQVSVAHSFTSSTFKVDSYVGAGGNENGRGFRFVAYKL